MERLERVRDVPRGHLNLKITQGKKRKVGSKGPASGGEKETAGAMALFHVVRSDVPCEMCQKTLCSCGYTEGRLATDRDGGESVAVSGNLQPLPPQRIVLTPSTAQK